MGHDEPNFEKKLQRFSVVKACPRCRQLSLMAKEGLIYCSSCGYKQEITSIR